MMFWLVLTCMSFFNDWADQLAALAAENPKADLAEAFRQLRPDGPLEADEMVLNSLGYRFLGNGETAAAIAVFQLNTALFPEKANPFDSLAEAYLTAGQPEEAVRFYELAFEKGPDRGIWDRLGGAYAALGDPDREVEYAKRGAERFNDVDAFDQYLAIRAKHGRIEDPRDAFGEISGKFPGRLLWRARQAFEAEGLALPKVVDGWRDSDYASEGLDPTPFEAVMKAVADGRFENLQGMVVTRGNTIIAEAYFQGFTRYRPHDTRSAGKSITALLAGIAIDGGSLRVTDPVYDFFPQYRSERDWQPAKDAVQVHHLLTMSSGLDAFDDGRPSPGSENFFQQTKTEWTDHVLRVPMAFEPGSQLVYASADYLLLGEVVAKAVKEPLDRFADRALFQPLGISEVTWFRAPDGHAYGGGGIRLTPRDLAKIGKLVLDKGFWAGKPVVSESWVASMTLPKLEGELWGKRYAYGWYRHRVPVGKREVTVLSAAGNGGQRIWVMPELDAVAVTTMGNYNSPKSAYADEILTEFIVPSLVPKP